jgi:hypothetical protein
MTGWRYSEQRHKTVLGLMLAVLLVMIGVQGVQTVWAANPPPQSSSIGLEATISSAPPSRGATIGVPR